MYKSIAAMTFAIGVFCSSAHSAEEAQETAALIKALPQASVSLAKGIETSEREGKPISAKFEWEHGALQLSVYASKGDSFKEVVVDYKSGEIKESETIADADDLKAARAQTAAMSKATGSLAHAVDAAVSANKGARAVSAFPKIQSGHPIASITLLADGKLKTVTEKLD